LLWL